MRTDRQRKVTIRQRQNRGFYTLLFYVKFPNIVTRHALLQIFQIHQHTKIQKHHLEDFRKFIQRSTYTGINQRDHCIIETGRLSRSV